MRVLILLIALIAIVSSQGTVNDPKTTTDRTGMDTTDMMTTRAKDTMSTTPMTMTSVACTTSGVRDDDYCYIHCVNDESIIYSATDAVNYATAASASPGSSRGEIDVVSFSFSCRTFRMFASGLVDGYFYYFIFRFFIIIIL